MGEEEDWEWKEEEKRNRIGEGREEDGREGIEERREGIREDKSEEDRPEEDWILKEHK